MIGTQELLGSPTPVLALPAGVLPPAVLVLGVGNLLMGDEGVGVHILRQLEHEPSLPGVRLLAKRATTRICIRDRGSGSAHRNSTPAQTPQPRS